MFVISAHWSDVEIVHWTGWFGSWYDIALVISTWSRRGVLTVFYFIMFVVIFCWHFSLRDTRIHRVMHVIGLYRL